MYRPSRTNRRGQADSQRTEAPNGSFHHLPQPYVERAQVMIVPFSRDQACTQAHKFLVQM
jgi:hypothetical protein